jgi:branched-chain amino acid transport system substrate-binding protein
VASPIGEVTVRAEDHQVMLPMFMGVTKKAPGEETLTATDIVVIPAAELMPSVEEIKKSRAK